MSNPLLKPNDPRFARPTITDAQGQNRFAEPDEAKRDEATPNSDNLFAAGSTGVAKTGLPYQPRYEETSAARGVWLLIAAVLGLAGAGAAASSLSGLLSFGWLLPICGAVASATAWLLAHQDLQAIKTGAINAAGRPLTLLTWWLGILGLVSCVATAAAMIWLGLSLLPPML